jgi:hypothetical protein
VDPDCVHAIGLQIADELGTVLAALREAAGPDTTIVGMNYYNPYLASWLDGADGQLLASDSAQAAVIFNDALTSTYGTADIAMADVYAAYESDDFVTMVSSPDGMVPVNVANICEFTYMCDAPPVGPDIHATVAGYSLIADTLENLLPAIP